MIPSEIKQEFINREKMDFRSYKKLSEADLHQRMLALPVQPPIWHKLNPIQKTCFIIGAETGRFCFWNDTGTGKSLLAIALVRYFRREGRVKHTLVLSPKRINKVEWQDELQKHSPSSSYLILPSSTEEKWNALNGSEALFVFETYSGLYRMVCDKEEKKVKGKLVSKLVPKPAKLKKLSDHFQGVVCDESVHVGNHSALPFRICRRLCSNSSNLVFTMTGTPFNRDPTLMWAQMFLVDGGYTLGETLGLFRSVFCKETENYWSGQPEFKFDKTKEEMLHGFIANRSISFPADEASLPGCISVQKYVSIGDDAFTYFKKFKQDLLAAQGRVVETRNAFIKLRQISSGFVGFEDEDGARAKFEFPDNPKLDLLLSIVTSIQADHKIVIFFDFTYSGERILRELNKAKIGAVILYGKTKDPEKVKRAFIDDPKIQVFILQNAMGEGLNIQIAKYGIFYESPVSAIKRKQCQRRVERQHSLHKTVFIYDLLMKNTMDEKILQFHKEGGDLFESIIRGEAEI